MNEFEKNITALTFKIKDLCAKEAGADCVAIVGALAHCLSSLFEILDDRTDEKEKEAIAKLRARVKHILKNV
jgi:hypothetical protein